MLLKFKANYKPTALKRPRLVSNRVVYDPSKKEKKEWLKTVLAYIPKKPFAGPLKINLEFFFPRPKNHFRTGKYKDLIKDKAPVIHTFMPDIDNLEKFVLDAMNEHFFEDDRQIVEISAHKEYINDYYNNKGYTIVTIYDYKKKSEIFKNNEPFTCLQTKNKSSLLTMLQTKDNSTKQEDNENQNENSSISSGNSSNSSSYSIII